MSRPFFPRRPRPLAHGFTCRICSLDHHPVTLASGERALCARCGGLLLKRTRTGRDAPLALTLAGIAFSIPALLFPVVTVGRFRQEHAAYLLTGADALWTGGMRVLSVWVTLCGTLAPVFLLGTLAALLIPARFGRPVPAGHPLWRIAHALEHWSIPEVYVLSILIAFTKLGALVDVTVGPGFWGFIAMSLAVVGAWRSFDFGWAEATAQDDPRPAPGDAATSPSL